ncbi:MAG: hypothetical protein IJ134_00190 [Bacilli bacterium]|nr:hypothetical protein [Bacilli bacterium]MBR1386343.1 hypothetical protein [Bacilli bacterium]
MINIPRPNKNIIEEYLVKWDNLEDHYIWQESSLDKLFHKDYKSNTDLNEILIKCSCLNDFYSTNIFLIYPVAKNIYDLKIDKRLKQGDPSLVNDIAHVTISGKEKVFYSFASKYCSHHNNVEFPIYDYFVDKMLMYFQKRDKFSNFKSNDLKDYVKFKNILIDFKKFYDIDEFNLRDIDKYLWIAGKEYFPKKY